MSFVSNPSIDLGALHVCDLKAATVDAGTFTAGSWITRTLNTVISNTIKDASLTANRITLGAGTYRISARAPAHQIELHQIRLQNITAASTILLGTSARSRASTATDGTNDSVINGRFVLTETSELELQHRSSGTLATSGQGVGNVLTWGNNIYATVFIEKIN